jgi:protease II
MPIKVIKEFTSTSKENYVIDVDKTSKGNYIIDVDKTSKENYVIDNKIKTNKFKTMENRTNDVESKQQSLQELIDNINHKINLIKNNTNGMSDLLGRIGTYEVPKEIISDFIKSDSEEKKTIVEELILIDKRLTNLNDYIFSNVMFLDNLMK